MTMHQQVRRRGKVVLVFVVVLLGAGWLGVLSLAVRPAAHDPTVGFGGRFPADGTDGVASGGGGGGAVELGQLLTWVNERAVIVVDARPPERFRAGHLPGAMNLPARDSQAPIPDEVAAYGHHVPVVVYCESRTCSDSHVVAARLKAAGLPRVLIFEGGWQAWSEQRTNLAAAD